MKGIARSIALAAPLTLVASLIGAQGISLGLRGSGSFPTGDFAAAQTASGQAAASDAAINGAKNGFGYGLDAGLSLGPLGIYASFDHIKFDCQTATCKTDGKYTLQGVTAGVKLTSDGSLLRPFVKAGLTFNDLQGGYGGSSSNALTTDSAPGYEIGVGADISFAGIFSFAPQARYVGQNLKAKIPGVNAPSPTGSGVNYFTFDMGLAVHTPFGK
ncbi:MAG: outer membrane beta-barrel protein [Gemmatimonadaceae bacterium]